MGAQDGPELALVSGLLGSRGGFARLLDHCRLFATIIGFILQATTESLPTCLSPPLAFATALNGFIAVTIDRSWAELDTVRGRSTSM